MSEWKEYRLKDLCSRLSSGKNIAASRISDTGAYPVYGGNGLRGYTDQANFAGDCAIIGRQGAFCGNVLHSHRDDRRKPSGSISGRTNLRGQRSVGFFQSRFRSLRRFSSHDRYEPDTQWIASLANS